MIQSFQNNVIVEVSTKYISNISSILKMAAIQNMSSVDPADYVNIMGTVVSVPSCIMDKREYKGFSLQDIEIGDTALFSYSVIYDLDPNSPEYPIYRNRIWHEGKELFAVDIPKLFAVIRNGEIIMLNGYVMTTVYKESKVVLPQHLKKIKKAAECEVMHIGYHKENENAINVFQGDKIYFNSFKAQKYQINGKSFCIINQKQILGKVLAN